MQNFLTYRILNNSLEPSNPYTSNPALANNNELCSVPIPIAGSRSSEFRGTSVPISLNNNPSCDLFERFYMMKNEKTEQAK